LVREKNFNFITIDTRAGTVPVHQLARFQTASLLLKAGIKRGWNASPIIFTPREILVQGRDINGTILLSMFRYKKSGSTSVSGISGSAPGGQSFSMKDILSNP